MSGLGTSETNTFNFALSCFGGPLGTGVFTPRYLFRRWYLR